MVTYIMVKYLCDRISDARAQCHVTTADRYVRETMKSLRSDEFTMANLVFHTNRDEEGLKSMNL